MIGNGQFDNSILRQSDGINLLAKRIRRLAAVRMESRIAPFVPIDRVVSPIIDNNAIAADFGDSSINFFSAAAGA